MVMSPGSMLVMGFVPVGVRMAMAVIMARLSRGGMGGEIRGRGRLGDPAREPHRDLCGRDPAAGDSGDFHGHAVVAQTCRERGEPLGRRADVYQGTEQHVAADAGGRIEDGEGLGGHEGIKYGRRFRLGANRPGRGRATPPRY